MKEDPFVALLLDSSSDPSARVSIACNRTFCVIFPRRDMCRYDAGAMHFLPHGSTWIRQSSPISEDTPPIPGDINERILRLTAALTGIDYRLLCLQICTAPDVRGCPIQWCVDVVSIQNEERSLFKKTHVSTGQALTELEQQLSQMARNKATETVKTLTALQTAGTKGDR